MWLCYAILYALRLIGEFLKVILQGLKSGEKQAPWSALEFLVGEVYASGFYRQIRLP